MPTSKRDAIKRKHSAIANSIQKAMDWTEELFTMFQPHHEKYAEGYALLHTNLEQCKEFIDKMKSHI